MTQEPPRPPARSTYRHGDLRRALLDAGIELALAGGPDAIVLREATRRAGVAPNAAYLHFAGRLDLLQEVRAICQPCSRSPRVPDGSDPHQGNCHAHQRHSRLV